MSELVIAGRIASMAGGATEDPRPGRVWIHDGQIVAVTKGKKQVAGFAKAPEVDVGDAFVLPGLIDMHNHMAYNVLPLWSEPGRNEPWMHNKHWTQADTYTESITEPAWVYVNACPEALIGYVQVRAMAGGATSAQGWPTANHGYHTVVRNVDSYGGNDLIYTSVATKTDDELVTAVRRMSDGSGFIYHCAEGQRGSRVLSDYVDLEHADGLLPTFIGIHCTAVDPDSWTKWDEGSAGGVVWSPLSNLVLYAQTTLIDDLRARGVKLCLGSDWGPSGTKNLLGEMKVARIAADHFGYALTDAQIVEMVTTNPGSLLERCWHSKIGQLVEGALADITVIRGRGGGSPWHRIVAATERDVALVIVDGLPRYGDTRLMTSAAASATFPMTVGGRQRRVALSDPANPAAAWSWNAIMSALEAVQRDPQTAIANARERAAAGPRFSDDAPLELFLDMPDSRRTGRAGPPRNPASVQIPPIPPLEHDAAYFDLLDAQPIQGGVLAPLRKRFGQ